MKETNFRHTDIGDIPHDWVLDTFDKVFTFIPNNTLPRDMLGKDGGVYDIHYGDVLIKYGSILDAEKDDIPSIKKESCYKASHYVKNGDVIIADTAEDETVGKICEVQNVCNKHIVSGLHTMWARPNDCVFAPKYLGYFMNGSIYHNQLLPFIQGIKVSSISKTAIKDTYIVIPPLAEQERIATALSDIDNLIAHLDFIIDKKKNIKQGAMQQLLTGKTRLHGFNEKWVKKKLGEISKLYQPATISQSQCTNYGYDVYGANGIIGKYPFYNHNKDQVVVTCRGNTCGKVNKTKGECWITGNAMVVNVDEYDIDKTFLFYLLSNSDLSTLITGSGQPQIVRTSIEKFFIPLPPSLAEQQAIASTLTAMDDEIQALQAQREKYTLIKQGMMQQLLTGKTRL